MVEKAGEKICNGTPEKVIPCLYTIRCITERQRSFFDNARYLISLVPEDLSAHKKIKETAEGLSAILESEKQGICALPDPLSSCPLRFGRDGICTYSKGELQKEDI